MFGTNLTLTWHTAKLGWVGHKSQLAEAQVSVPCLPKLCGRQYSIHGGEGWHQAELVLSYVHMFVFFNPTVQYQKKNFKL